MHPCMFGGFDLKPQRLKSLAFVCEVSQGYFERNVVNGGGRRVRPAMAGTVGAVE